LIAIDMDFGRRFHRRELGHDVDAIAIVLDHPRKPAHLALDPMEAF
jgi:hypothetical protein